MSMVKSLMEKDLLDWIDSSTEEETTSSPAEKIPSCDFKDEPPLEEFAVPSTADGITTIKNSHIIMNSEIPSNITIRNSWGERIVEICTNTGTVTFFPGYTADEASDVFWSHLAGMSPLKYKAMYEEMRSNYESLVKTAYCQPPDERTAEVVLDLTRLRRLDLESKLTTEDTNNYNRAMKIVNDN
jgi:hypothetical protein